jgi:hypothetical protein
MVLGSFWILVSFVHMQSHNCYRTKRPNQATALKNLVLQMKNFFVCFCIDRLLFLLVSTVVGHGIGGVSSMLYQT